ncbi:hypothetical protein IM816_08885 [Luteibacter flocculans]|uniref:Single-stranded DNA-binding protein n=1 Tax=Luteibacter flocculans TaxID=2780091 RepID=A0ABY4T8I6_9GAMM|nr:G5P family DNA-binding protein [Luteibacter flocculans]URL60172.1 hypothetical protein IM816_08885 [Luteibacter flocculans]
MAQTIRIEDTKVETRSGTSARTGKAYSMREQKAYLVGLAKYPVEINLTLPDDVDAYPVGEYVMETPLSVGRFNRPELGRNLGLVPVKSAARVASA